MRRAWSPCRPPTRSTSRMLLIDESVLPKAVSARVAVEAGIADYWFKYVGLNGAIVGMTTFGESAPAEQLFEEFGFTVDNVLAKAKALL
ncbi:hypothetical protein LNP25_19315 [Klebsiella variicola subsp. variicola]|nr:hypothetical protein [Klebsiella variicola subsp. variicola]